MTSQPLRSSNGTFLSLQTLLKNGVKFLLNFHTSMKRSNYNAHLTITSRARNFYEVIVNEGEAPVDIAS